MSSKERNRILIVIYRNINMSNIIVAKSTVKEKFNSFFDTAKSGAKVVLLNTVYSIIAPTVYIGALSYKISRKFTRDSMINIIVWLLVVMFSSMATITAMFKGGLFYWIPVLAYSLYLTIRVLLSK